MERPIIRHGFTYVSVDGKPVPIRIMLVKYDEFIETYYQEDGYAFEFAYGIALSEGFKKAMKMAVRNAKEWGVHND